LQRELLEIVSRLGLNLSESGFIKDATPLWRPPMYHGDISSSADTVGVGCSRIRLRVWDKLRFNAKMQRAQRKINAEYTSIAEWISFPITKAVLNMPAGSDDIVVWLQFLFPLPF
jgi:hypothetical protein